MSDIITNLALDGFTSDELARIRLAATAVCQVGAAGILILPGKPENYLLRRTKEGIILSLATDEETAKVLSGMAI